MALLDRAIVRLLPAVPRPLVRRLSSRYIAGPDARRRRARRPAAERQGQARDGRRARRGDRERRTRRARSPASTTTCSRGSTTRASTRTSRSSSPGSASSSTYDLCRENLEAVVADAAARGNFVRIDMEDSSTTDAHARASTASCARAGHENVGVVLQAYLRRTLADVRGLDNVRLCKGIYVEPPRSPSSDPDEVRASFARARSRRSLDAGRLRRDRDPRRVPDRRSAAHRRRRGLRADRYEFQMLLGVRSDRGDELVARGPPAARLRPVRHALVRVLAPAAAGEPEDRRLRRRRHAAAARVPRFSSAVVEAPEDAVAAAVGAGSSSSRVSYRHLTARFESLSLPAAASCPASRGCGVHARSGQRRPARAHSVIQIAWKSSVSVVGGRSCPGRRRAPQVQPRGRRPRGWPQSSSRVLTAPVCPAREKSLDGEREAAVDDEHLAADHLGVRRAEERDRAGDVLGLDEPAGRVRARRARASPPGWGSARARPSRRRLPTRR